MASIASLSKMVSGLKAAQKGLQVTSHNISNANTKGYTRQQSIQAESPYINIGTAASSLMQVGLGVSVQEIRQIRSDLADTRFRESNSRLGYYQTLTSTTQEIDAYLDEPYGTNISALLQNFYSQTNKLQLDPAGTETRLAFLNASATLADGINSLAKSLSTYQATLDIEVTKSTKRINEIVNEIAQLNEKISLAEVGDDNANDYRDSRNLLLDELSEYGKIDYNEDGNGQLLVKFEEHIVVNKGLATTMELVPAKPSGSTFVKPIWSDTGSDVCDLDQVLAPGTGNDTGRLKALIVSRGDSLVTNQTDWDDVALDDNRSVEEEGNAYIVPKLLMQLNELADKITTVVNESLNGTGIGAAKGQDGLPVFVEIETGSGLIAGNVQVNPKLLESGGYNWLGTVSKAVSSSAALDSIKYGDDSKIKGLLEEWQTKREWFTSTLPSAPSEKLTSISSFYTEAITDFATDAKSYSQQSISNATNITNIENERQAMGGVSTDEELASMLKYQYAYNASARVITIMDTMLDTVINRM